jgi:hypothetical protein
MKKEAQPKVTGKTYREVPEAALNALEKAVRMADGALGRAERFRLGADVRNGLSPAFRAHADASNVLQEITNAAKSVLEPQEEQTSERVTSGRSFLIDALLKETTSERSLVQVAVERLEDPREIRAFFVACLSGSAVRTVELGHGLLSDEALAVNVVLVTLTNRDFLNEELGRVLVGQPKEKQELWRYAWLSEGLSELAEFVLGRSMENGSFDLRRTEEA